MNLDYYSSPDRSNRNKFRLDNFIENIMRKTLLVLFFALFSTQVLAEKEPREYPWAKAARIIEADEAKSKKTEQRRKAETGKPEKRSEKKIEAENKQDK